MANGNAIPRPQWIAGSGVKAMSIRNLDHVAVIYAGSDSTVSPSNAEYTIQPQESIAWPQEMPLWVCCAPSVASVQYQTLIGGNVTQPGSVIAVPPGAASAGANLVPIPALTANNLNLVTNPSVDVFTQIGGFGLYGFIVIAYKSGANSTGQWGLATMKWLDDDGTVIATQFHTYRSTPVGAPSYGFAVFPVVSNIATLTLTNASNTDGASLEWVRVYGTDVKPDSLVGWNTPSLIGGIGGTPMFNINNGPIFDQSITAPPANNSVNFDLSGFFREGKYLFNVYVALADQVAPGPTKCVISIAREGANEAIGNIAVFEITLFELNPGDATQWQGQGIIEVDMNEFVRIDSTPNNPGYTINVSAMIDTAWGADSNIIVEMTSV